MQQLAENVYTADTSVIFYGTSIPTRMAIIRLTDGSLLVYSPIFLSRKLKQEIAELGPVSCVVAPNKIHNQALADYAQHYPKAKIFASPGLPERKPEIAYAGVLTDKAEPQWENEIEQVLTKGNIFFSEALFFHKASRTMLVCDFVENINESTTPITPLFKLFGVQARPMASPEFRFYTHDRAAAKLALNTAMSWDIERIFLCHGDIIVENAKGVFAGVCSEFLAGVSRKGRLNRLVSKVFARYQ